MWSSLSWWWQKIWSTPNTTNNDSNGTNVIAGGFGDICIHLFDIAIHCITPIYIIWIIIAIVSNYSSYLRIIASRGKTTQLYSNNNQISNPYKEEESSSSSSSVAALLVSSFSSESWVPKSYFSHYYIVGLISMLVFTIISATMGSIYVGRDEQHRHRHHQPQQPTQEQRSKMSMVPMSISAIPITTHGIVILLTLIHLSRRLYECLYVHQWKTTTRNNDSTTNNSSISSNVSVSRMHIMTYLGGMIHYLILPFTIVIIILPRQSLSTSLTWTTTATSTTTSSSTTSPSSIMVCLLLIVFNLYAQYEQYQHHIILANIRIRLQSQSQSRSLQQQSPTTTANDKRLMRRPSSQEYSSSNNDCYYSIPTERWFQYVACPHYFAEILIYLSLVLLIDITTLTTTASTTSSTTSIKSSSDLTDFMLHQTIKIVVSLLRWGTSHRHWFLLLWVIANLTISARTTLQWNKNRLQQQQRRRRLVAPPPESCIISNDSNDAPIPQRSSYSYSSSTTTLKENPNQKIAAIVNNQKAIIPWIY